MFAFVPVPVSVPGRPAATAWRHPLGRLILLRWCSIAVMLACPLLLPRLLDLAWPLHGSWAAALALLAFNLLSLSWLTAGRGAHHGEGGRGGGAHGTLMRMLSAPFAQLCADVAGWSVFLYFCGGATNPLISLLLPLVAIGAAVLPARQAWALAGLAVLAYSALWHGHRPLPLYDTALAAKWHLSGMWATFALSACVIVGFVLRMTRALRERDQALARAREARARDAHVLALADLAAGAAHNLGTPLGTLRILIDELRRDARLPDEVQADLALMQEQVAQCKQTLSLLTAEAGGLRAEGGAAMAAATWLEQSLDDWRRRRPRDTVSLQCAPALAGLSIVADRSLRQALHMLMDNAAQASPGAVAVVARIDGEAFVVDVADRGQGMPSALLDAAGTAWPDGAARGDGLGIGLMLARAALDRHAGQLAFRPREGGGTVASMVLPLQRIRT